MKIAWIILRFVFKIVAFTPTATIKLLIPTIKNVKLEAKLGKKDNEDILNLIGYIAVLLPIIYGIVVVILEYVTKAQTGVWDSAAPLRAVEPPLFTVCSIGAFILLATEAIKFFQKNQKLKSVKKTFKESWDDILISILNSLWLVLVMPLVVFVLSIGSLIAIVIVWMLIASAVIYFMTSESPNEISSSYGLGLSGENSKDEPKEKKNQANTKDGPKEKKNQANTKDDNVKHFSANAKFIRETGYSYGGNEIISAQQGLGPYNFVCTARDFDSGKVIIMRGDKQVKYITKSR